MSNSFDHKDLTDAQWNRIKFVFEKRAKVGRPSLNPRTAFNAIMWILKSGMRWRDLPARYSNWNSIYHKFRLWCSLGLFKRLLQLINAGTKDTTFLEIDSTFCKVHQSACSALKDQAIGSSRDGKNAKVHVLINERMQLLNMVLTGGQIHDSEEAIALLKGIEFKGKKILADKAYSCEHIRVFIAEHGAFACIPDKANFKIKHDFDSKLYKQRNIVERFFQRIKNYRHVATRYDKLALCFGNFILLATFYHSLLIYQQPLGTSAIFCHFPFGAHNTDTRTFVYKTTINFATAFQERGVYAFSMLARNKKTPYEGSQGLIWLMEKNCNTKLLEK